MGVADQVRVPAGMYIGYRVRILRYPSFPTLILVFSALPPLSLFVYRLSSVTAPSNRAKDLGIVSFLSLFSNNFPAFCFLITQDDWGGRSGAKLDGMGWDGTDAGGSSNAGQDGGQAGPTSMSSFFCLYSPLFSFSPFFFLVLFQSFFSQREYSNRRGGTGRDQRGRRQQCGA